jgi:hypothetical protein
MGGNEMDEHVKLLSKYGTDYTLVEAENVTLRERVVTLEKRLGLAESRAEHNEARANEADILEATCAAMREFINHLRYRGGFAVLCDECTDNHYVHHGTRDIPDEYCDNNCPTDKALSPDAGKALLERLAKAESKVKHVQKCADEIMEISNTTEEDLRARLAKAEAELSNLLPWCWKFP